MPQPPSRTKFYLDKRHGKIMGVCSGIADYTGLDVTLVRIMVAGAVFMSGGSVLPLYFIAGFIAVIPLYVLGLLTSYFATRLIATQAYGNWLGILKGTLTERMNKGGKSFLRSLNPDRVYTRPQGNGELALHGRSLLFVRNVGHLMTNPAILWEGGKEIPEGIMDAVITTTIEALTTSWPVGQVTLRSSATTP